MTDIDPGGEKERELRYDVDRLLRDSGMVRIDPENYQQLLDDIVDMVFAQARGEE